MSLNFFTLVLLVRVLSIHLICFRSANSISERISSLQIHDFQNVTACSRFSAIFF
ncbi:hypothetical protein M758_4G205200 [Ceratodon purpureus]|nr:hypothetical protein M758_4G205200 [Ceratodon purpureus]